LNTKQAIAYIKNRTGRDILPHHLSRYEGLGWIHPHRVYLFDNEYHENEYDIADVNAFCDCLTALSRQEARQQLAAATGHSVSIERMKALCETFEGSLLRNGRDWRIPADMLPALAEALQEQFDAEAAQLVSVGEAQAVVRALIDQGLAQYEIARRADVSQSLISHVVAGRKSTSREVFDRLVRLQENTP